MQMKAERKVLLTFVLAGAVPPAWRWSVQLRYWFAADFARSSGESIQAWSGLC